MKNFLDHDRQWEQLTQLFQEGRLPHGLLFTGPEGVGKRQVALDLARTMLECGTNPAEHPDFISLEPEGKSIKIDRIREIKATLPYAPLRGRCRIILINDAHLMRAGAANALLKSLEEPPEGNYFILITHALGWIPSTIRSRCQIFRFAPLQESHLRKILAEQNIDLPEAMLPWTQGSVSLSRIISEAKDRVPSLRSLFPSREGIHFGQAYELAQSVAETGQVEPFLQTLLLALHQVMVGPRKNQKYDFDLLTFADRILEIQGGLRQNINPKINLTRLLMHFQEPKESRL